MDSTVLLVAFKKAVSQFDAALAQEAETELVRAGCIQYFEFCFELSWKAIKISCQEQGLPECYSPKSCLRQAYSNGWIENEENWLQMLDARNKMSHTYSINDALKIYTELPKYLNEFKSLLKTINTIAPST